MQIATVPVQICMGTIACAYNFLTIFSLSSLYLTLSSLSLSLSLSLSWRTALSFFLSSDQSFFLSSIFLPLASVDRHCRRRSPSQPPIALSSFVSCCFRVEWAWSVGFGLNGIECLSPSPPPPLAFRGVDLVAQGEASILGGLWGLCCWVCFDSKLLDCVVGLCWFRVRRSCCWVCFSSFLSVGCVDSNVIPVWVGGCVGKEMYILFE